MSDRVVVMFGGRIAQLGAPAEIYDSPSSTLEVAGFVGQVNLIDAEVIGRPRAASTACAAASAR